MEEEAVEEESGQNPHIRARHIKKRSLKNKALAVSFNEKDLKYSISSLKHLNLFCYNVLNMRFLLLGFQ